MENQNTSKNLPAVNFIKHFRNVYDHLINDDRCGPQHFTLYFALFGVWNHYRFSASIPIVREDLMRQARIGSVKTYTKCMYDLHVWDYLRYEPNFNSHKGTKVYMFRFDIEDDRRNNSHYENNGTDTGHGKSDQATAHADEQAGEHAPVQPLLNVLINKKNNVKSPNIINGEARRRYEDQHFLGTNDLMPWQRQDACSEEDDLPNPAFDEETSDPDAIPRTLGEVKAYFKNKNSTADEAENFYNYYGAVGWIVGGDHMPVANWRAVAYRWIINEKRYKN